jgi:hypothetical protein
VVGPGELCSADNGSILAVAGADEEDEACPSRNLLDYPGSSAQMGSCGLERDDVGALADTIYVAGVCGIPERGGMAVVGLRCEKELEGDVGERGGMAKESVRLVMGRDLGTQVPYGLLWRRSAGQQDGAGEGMLTLLFIEVILLGNRQGGGLGGSGGWVVGRHSLRSLVIDVGLYGMQLLEAVLGGGCNGIDIRREEAARWLRGIASKGARPCDGRSVRRQAIEHQAAYHGGQRDAV